MMMQLPYGVIFDMDGVLVDSEELICKAICQMFAEAGLHIRSEDFGLFVGTGKAAALEASPRNTISQRETHRSRLFRPNLAEVAENVYKLQ
jgi:beta-phosphoglucomutase-like phosphatase (HAD superfamily)